MSHLPKAEVESHYHRDGHYFLIELNLGSVRQLTNSLDPAPFRERDLDEDAENYIVEAVREFPLKTPLKLRFHLQHREEADQRAIEQAVRNYFEYRTQVTARELREKLKQGRVSLVIGLSFLILCIALGRVAAVVGEGLLVDLIQEGLLIGGWVAMWRPIEIFLYDWWPIARRRKVYEKIRAMPAEVRDAGEGARSTVRGQAA